MSTHKPLALGTALVLMALTGCTDLKPLEAQIADLKSQLTRLQADSQATRQVADQAASAGQSASQTASAAQASANQAVAASQASQSCCDATNEKLDRMFRRSVSK